MYFLCTRFPVELFSASHPSAFIMGHRHLRSLPLRSTCAGLRDSTRGVGFAFGADVFERFCRANRVQLLVRAHEGPDARQDYPSANPKRSAVSRGGERRGDVRTEGGQNVNTRKQGGPASTPTGCGATSSTSNNSVHVRTSTHSQQAFTSAHHVWKLAAGLMGVLCRFAHLFGQHDVGPQLRHDHAPRLPPSDALQRRQLREWQRAPRQHGRDPPAAPNSLRPYHIACRQGHRAGAVPDDPEQVCLPAWFGEADYASGVGELRC